MTGRYNVLFLCTGNSARSIMAEAILNRKGRPNFQAYSAGSHPTGRVRQRRCGKSSTRICHGRFAQQGLGRICEPGAPQMNFVFTVCDNAAKKLSRVAGPADDGALGRAGSSSRGRLTGRDRASFRDAFMTLDRRISLLLCLPLSSLDKLAIKREIDRIGQQ